MSQTRDWISIDICHGLFMFNGLTIPYLLCINFLFLILVTVVEILDFEVLIHKIAFDKFIAKDMVFQNYTVIFKL
jgi:hypothetical protein